MSTLVDPTEIEQIVGVERHATEHWGRAVSGEQIVYILHSVECRDRTPDLRDCPYSVALDNGIEDLLPRTAWRRLQNVAVKLQTSRMRGTDYLLPDFATYKAALTEVQP